MSYTKDGSLICDRCGCIAEDGDEFCVKCGATIDHVYLCPQCHKEIMQEDTFCPFCGFTLQEKLSSETASQIADIAQKQAEEERAAREAERIRAEEELRQLEIQRKAEEQRLAELAQKAAEQERLAKLAEETRIAQEQKLAESKQTDVHPQEDDSPVPVTTAKQKKPAKPKRKRPLLVGIIACVLIVAIVVSVLFVKQYYSPDAVAYRDAVSLMETGQYINAMHGFQNLGEYKDSQEQSVNCALAAVEDFFKNGMPSYFGANHKAAAELYLRYCETDSRFAALVEQYPDNAHYLLGFYFFEIKNDSEKALAELALSSLPEAATLSESIKEAVALSEKWDGVYKFTRYTSTFYSETTARFIKLWGSDLTVHSAQLTMSFSGQSRDYAIVFDGDFIVSPTDSCVLSEDPKSLGTELITLENNAITVRVYNGDKTSYIELVYIREVD